MLMWEISSGQPPFINKHNYDLAIKIINGMRPKITPDTPLEYKELMEQCWDANPMKRPDTYTLADKISDIYRSYCQNENEQRIINKIMSINNSQLNTRFNVNSSFSDSSFFGNFSASSSNWNISSRVYNFENLPEPRNATKDEVSNSNKKVNSNNNEDHEIGFQYLQRNYATILIITKYTDIWLTNAKS
ncbi:hypothetical protein C1646_797482 [Rhizophagus diaphanus]|nr:hypothetical protein C1646_797482 [Rhizophagus diaphanus] [Rhizophagus sp. MUCL 43196]